MILDVALIESESDPKQIRYIPILRVCLEEARGKVVTNDFTRSCRSNGLTAKKAHAHARALRRMVTILHAFCGPAEYVIISILWK